MLELAENISKLEKAGELLEEVIIVNNCSSQDYSMVEEFISSHPQIPFRYFMAPSNLGVAKGRNYALAKGSAPIVILLDDDAVLGNSDCLIRLLEVFEAPYDTRPRAIISFKVIYYDSGQMQVNALPHKDFNSHKHLPFFETYYYAGGAHAIQRSVIEKVGAYPEDFFYGMEEYDLSYRILDAGYSIAYSDKIIMRHKESPFGRPPREEKIRMMWVNKSKVAFRHLPKRYFISTAVMWSLQYLRSTSFNLRGFFKGWKSIFNIPTTEKRTPIKTNTLDYLKQVHARLWY